MADIDVIARGLASAALLRASAAKNAYIATVDGGILAGSTADQGAGIIAATAAAAAAGKACAFPAGKVYYTGIIPVLSSIIGEGSTQTQFINISANGSGGLFDCQNQSDLIFSGFSITAQNGVGVTSSENDSGLRLTYVNRYLIDDIRFSKITGAALLQRHCSYGLITRGLTVDCWHDSFHVTGSSKSIVYLAPRVVNGGDDGIAIVGYQKDGVRPSGITVVAPEINGTKYARGIAVVGAQNVVVQSPRVSRTRAAGVYVSADSAYGTYANDDILIDDMIVDGCGAASQVSLDTGGYVAFSMPAVYVSASAGLNNNNIVMRGKVRNSANTGLFTAANGGYVTNSDFSGVVVDGSWDPYNLNGFPLTTTAAVNASPTLPFANTMGSAYGQDAIASVSGTLQRIGGVIAATPTSITLDTNVTLPSGTVVYFKGGGFLPATAKLTAAATSGATSVAVATSGVLATNSADPTSLYVGATLAGTGLAADTVMTGFVAGQITFFPATTAALASGAAITTSPPWYFDATSTTVNAAFAAGVDTITVTANNGITKGQAFTGGAPGTFVLNANGLTIKLTQPLPSALASGAAVSFGFIGQSAKNGVQINAAKDLNLRGMRVRASGQYSVVFGDGLGGIIDARDIIGEEVACTSAFGRHLHDAGTLGAGTVLKKEGTWMALPSNWPRKFDTLIYSPAANWQYTEWGPNNKCQNNAVGMNVGLASLVAVQATSGTSYTYTNNYPSTVSLSFVGGVVSDISVKRNGHSVAFTIAGASPALVDLRPLDSVTATFTSGSAPTVTLIPRLA
jgi:hypothetical protein